MNTLFTIGVFFLCICVDWMRIWTGNWKRRWVPFWRPRPMHFEMHIHCNFNFRMITFEHTVKTESMAIHIWILLSVNKSKWMEKQSYPIDANILIFNVSSNTAMNLKFIHSFDFSRFRFKSEQCQYSDFSSSAFRIIYSDKWCSYRFLYCHLLATAFFFSKFNVIIHDCIQIGSSYTFLYHQFKFVFSSSFSFLPQPNCKYTMGIYYSQK